ncbi:MAG: hypothetical protein ABSA85_07970 [Terracidiphilus sp.]|jgi:hypothetical protein
MFLSLRPSRWPRRWIIWIAMGLVLRLAFIVFPRPGDDDTLDYLQLGHNLLHAGIYGYGSGYDVSPTTYRLPAYPIFLATFEMLFARLWPSAWFNAVYLFQTAVDLASGLLLAAFAGRHLSSRAAEVALVLAMLCPFTAAYAAIAMTECLSVFAVSLGLYAAGRAITAESKGTRDIWALVLAGCASAFAMLLRPDGVALFASLAFGLLFYVLRGSAKSRLTHMSVRRVFAAASIFCAASLLPLVPWTVHNWADFHVFQPLAPRYNDPGEPSVAGARRWLRTWTIDFVSTAYVCWNFPGASIDPADLPRRAFDSPEQREQTLALIKEFNRTYTLPDPLVERFAALAAERIHNHPIRYYVALPLLRDADMLLRPRTLEYNLDVDWWRWSNHPAQSAWAILLGLINLFYVATATWAFIRGRVPFAWMLGSYLIFRFMILGTLEAPEPRYTIECFPVLIIAAAAAFTPRRSPAALQDAPS